MNGVAPADNPFGPRRQNNCASFERKKERKRERERKKERKKKSLGRLNGWNGPIFTGTRRKRETERKVGVNNHHNKPFLNKFSR